MLWGQGVVYREDGDVEVFGPLSEVDAVGFRGLGDESSPVTVDQQTAGHRQAMAGVLATVS